MKDEDSRKRSKNETGSYTRHWSIYVLEDRYHGKVKVFRIDFLIDFLFVANVIKNVLEIPRILEDVEGIRCRNSGIRQKAILRQKRTKHNKTY